MTIVTLSKSVWLPAVAWTVSLSAHAIAIRGLDAIPVELLVARAPVAVEFTVKPRPVPPPPPTVEAPPPPEPVVREVTVAPASAKAPPPAPEPATPPASEPPPVDLTGVTLTNGSGEGWASAVGNGASMSAPIRAPRRPASARTEPREVSKSPVLGQSRQKAPEQASFVAVADLSRRPSPPALQGRLRENYPAEARRVGLAGEARVIARVDADGRVRQVSLASESSPGFGAACRNAVMGSLWSPPLDARGRPVATQVYYSCRFQVDR